MSWYDPRTWRTSEPQSVSLFREAKDRSFDEIIRLMFSNTVSSGENVTPANAMRCSTVHAIVRALTNAMGSYPIKVFRERTDDDGKTTLEPLPNHNVNRLLKNPNKRMTQTVFFRRVMLHVALWGNHISTKGQGGSGPISFLRPVHPDQVTMLDDDELNPVYQITFKNETRTYNARQVFHVTGGVSVSGAWAPSPVEDAAETIGMAIAAERVMAELFGNSGIPSFLLTGGRFSSEEQYDLWVRKWEAAYGRGGAHSGGTALLPDGMDAKQVALSMVDAQTLEARKFQRTEIAAIWGVPPHKLADLERATFSNIEHQGLEFLQDVMLPYVRLVEQALERDVLTDDDRRGGVVIRFDLDGAERADFKSRVEGYSKMHAVGAISPNEIRAREGMNPREDGGGDAYASPLNMRVSNESSDTDAGIADADSESDSDAENDDVALRSV